MAAFRQRVEIAMIGAIEIVQAIINVTSSMGMHEI